MSYRRGTLSGPPSLPGSGTLNAVASVAGLIPGVGGVISLAAGLFNQNASKRAQTLSRDVAAAQGRIPSETGAARPSTDYLLYFQAHGNNVTQYEFDNLRAQAGPYTGTPQQNASGLFQATIQALNALQQGLTDAARSALPGAGSRGAPSGFSLPMWVPLAGVGLLGAMVLLKKATKKARS